MKRRLLVLRHAKSERGGDAANDIDRPLSKRGRKDAPRVGEWLKAQGLTPDHVLCSPAVRARDTVHAVVDALGLPREQVSFDERLYLAAPETLLEVLSAVPAKAGAVLLVGHNPGLDGLVEYLAADMPAHTASGKLMTTAALAWIETDDPWRRLEPGCGNLVALVRPKEQ
jgi:phosphohistidine phosphatase